MFQQAHATVLPSGESAGRLVVDAIHVPTSPRYGVALWWVSWTPGGGRPRRLNYPLPHTLANVNAQCDKQAITATTTVVNSRLRPRYGAAPGGSI